MVPNNDSKITELMSPDANSPITNFMEAVAAHDPDALEWLDGRRRPFESLYGLGLNGCAGLFLGCVFGAHAIILVQLLAGVVPWSLVAVRWCCYALALAAFHSAEFLTTARYKWRDLSFDSWLLNHSRAYGIAFLAAVAEFWAEAALAPGLKAYPATLWAGAAVVGLGHGARVLAMVTCGEHFAHRIMTRREPGHRLVTSGVYAVLRHPSYTGWFWWSVGTQLVLANPVCLVAYACASYGFFADRIPYEEATLRRFYPAEYPAYAARTWVLIPFLKAA